MHFPSLEFDNPAAVFLPDRRRLTFTVVNTAHPGRPPLTPNTHAAPISAPALGFCFIKIGAPPSQISLLQNPCLYHFSVTLPNRMHHSLLTPPTKCPPWLKSDQLFRSAGVGAYWSSRPGGPRPMLNFT